MWWRIWSGSRTGCTAENGTAPACAAAHARPLQAALSSTRTLHGCAAAVHTRTRPLRGGAPCPHVPAHFRAARRARAHLHTSRRRAVPVLIRPLQGHAHARAHPPSSGPRTRARLPAHFGATHTPAHYKKSRQAICQPPIRKV